MMTMIPAPNSCEAPNNRPSLGWEKEGQRRRRRRWWWWKRRIITIDDMMRRRRRRNAGERGGIKSVVPIPTNCLQVP
jgi:hypothetical protein